MTRRKGKTQVTNIRNETRYISTEPKDIKRIKRDYEQLYTQKFNNSDEIDQFLKKITITTYVIFYFNLHRTIKEIKSIIFKTLKKKSKSRWFRRTLPNLKKRIHTNSTQCLPENRREHFPIHLFRIIPKADKNSTIK